MKISYRIVSLMLAVIMVISLCACSNGRHDIQPETTGVEEQDTTEDGSQKTSDDITIRLHYLRDDGNYEGWNVWFWTTSAGKQYDFENTVDDDGVTCSAHFDAGTRRVGFLVRLNDWDAKDYADDRYIDTSKYITGTIDVYVISGHSIVDVKYNNDCVKGTAVESAVMSDDYESVTVFLSDSAEDNMTIAIYDANGDELESESVTVDERNKEKVIVKLKEKADWAGSYTVLLNGVCKFMIKIPDFYSTEDFENKYSYAGNDLGASLEGNTTTFKVWAPMADSVTVNLYRSGDESADDLIRTLSMKEEDNGVWSYVETQSLSGVYYTYTVERDGEKTEACDPYAKAVGVNGDRAMVIDMGSTDPDGWDKDVNPNKGMNYTDAIIYETHVRDFSIDGSSGIKAKGKYLGMTETGTKNSAGEATGLDHVKELGITHLQLSPVFDYATVDESNLSKAQYNWGYDPKNYNVPEGSYSSDPYNGEVRIKEFKQMVKGLHDNGLSVVMDVVYNHTYNSEFCYNMIVPGYFHRPDSNGSACGNDVASERLMVRKYIVESVVYWAEEYHIDGFRFDLVGLIDAETIQEIRKALDEIDPSIILYGEGWSLDTKTTKDYTFLATQNNVSRIDNFAMFNDSIRDTLKGTVFIPSDKGYINGETGQTTSLKRYIQGMVSWSSLPYQQVNYASCHDNLTLWDEINTSNASDPYESRVKQNLMSAAIIYTAQGIPFIFSGEEMLRSKVKADGTFDENSYNSPDSVNSIKWDSLSGASQQKAFSYYKGLIEFRKAHPAFRNMDKASSYYKFNNDVEDGVIAYELLPCNGETADGIYVIHNPLSKDVTVELPDGTWTIYVSGSTAGTKSLGNISGKITVDSMTTTILVK
ncbi:MAG: type I pullulanase [Lachnospiraceae bacterium]|nr:type I pullulanase [Lachnospiraceae bacterium]